MAREVLLSRAIDGFLVHKAAEGKSPHTLADYRNCLGKLLAYTGDVPLAGVGVTRLRGFFAHLHDGYTTTPRGCAPRPEQKLSEKTIRNIHIAVSSFFTWCVAEELAKANPMRRIDRPRGDPPPISPFTEAEIKALLAATQNTAPWHNRPATFTARATAARDYAIVLLLLDTGIRASELANLTPAGVDRITGHVEVLHGKGNKSRTVRASRATVRAIWRYLDSRPPNLPDTAPLFASRGDEALTRYGLLRLLKRLGERAGVRGVTIHRFRHTFAIQYLRNKGDIYTLQLLLGHSSLDMVRHYLEIAQADIDTAHRGASPVQNWRL